MENVTFDDGRASQFDAVCANASLDYSADRQFLRDNLAFYFCTFVYRNGQSSEFSFDLTEHLDCPLAKNFADHSNTATDRGDLILGNATLQSSTSV